MHVARSQASARVTSTTSSCSADDDPAVYEAIVGRRRGSYPGSSILSTRIDAMTPAAWRCVARFRVSGLASKFFLRHPGEFTRRRFTRLCSVIEGPWARIAFPRHDPHSLIADRGLAENLRRRSVGAGGAELDVPYVIPFRARRWRDAAHLRRGVRRRRDVKVRVSGQPAKSCRDSVSGHDFRSTRFEIGS